MISIITPSFNSGKYIRQTIQSVLDQEGIRLEYIVVDGGSTDETLDIIRSFGDRLRYISESDQGQSDAITKGIRMSKGKIIAWLNADDYYAPGTLEFATKYFSENPDVMLMYGDADIVNENGEFIGRYPTESFVFDRLASKCFICQPVAFWRRELWEAIGPLDTSLHYAIDLDFWIRAGKALEKHSGWRFAYVTQVLAYSRLHTLAKTMAHHKEFLDEIAGVVKKYFGYVAFPWIYGMEEIRDPRYDGVIEKSPLSFGLIIRSVVKWMWHNRTRPDHIIRFFIKVLFSPRKSWQTMVERVK
jgi:glycosyltransferase involved in cell wall biosynthesis